MNDLVSNLRALAETDVDLEDVTGFMDEHALKMFFVLKVNINVQC